MSSTFSQLLCDDEKTPENCKIIIEEEMGGVGKATTPDTSFILYNLADYYLKKKYHVVCVMASNGPTHYLASMKKMGINYALYSSKGFFSYIDLFSNPFSDLDFESLPLSETCPPTYDSSLQFKDLKVVTLNADSPARDNLAKIANEILVKSQNGSRTIGCKGVLILFDTLNVIFDSIGANQLEMLEFTESINEICSVISLTKAKEEPKAKSKPKQPQKYEDDYYDEDDDDDDMAAIRARKAMFKKPTQATLEEDDKEADEQSANLSFVSCLTFNIDLFLDSKFSAFYNEVIKKDCNLLFEIHNNQSGYSMDVDGTIEVKKYLKDDNDYLSVKTKINRKFKIRENKVDYFEFISI